MPQLKRREDNRQKFWLPSTQNEADENKIWVELNLRDLSIGELAQASDDNDSNAEAGIRMVWGRISNWNVTDENNQPLPISFENVQLLDLDDFTFLATKLKSVKDKLGGLTEDQKKV